MIYDVSDDVRTTEQRIEDEQKRIDRLRPAFDFYDAINTGLDPHDIRRRLEVTRLQIRQVKERLKDFEK